MELTQEYKKIKRKPVIDLNAETVVRVNYVWEDIYKILPNRPPFLFLQKITGIDLKNEAICGECLIDKQDPVFQGHFPGNPVYPGVLQLEMISELFCCLYYFIRRNSTDIGSDGPVQLRATRMHDSVLQYGLFPGDKITIIAKVIDNNDLTFTGIGQIVKGDRIAVAVAGEYYIIDED